jgi:NitT/TauT family transport system permease protein
VLSFLSITVTGFIALFPGSLLGVECASIFAIFTGQVWNMAFGFYHSLVTIPDDLREAAKSYGLNPVRRFVKVELPASAYSLIWNSMMSFGGGWFFVAQSEAITVLGQNIQLPGLGSYMANVVQTGNYRGAVLAIMAMITLIVASDQLIWRPLLAWADKFKIQLTESTDRPTSWVLNLLRRSYVVSWLTEKVANTWEDTLFWITSYFRSKSNHRTSHLRAWVLHILASSGDDHCGHVDLDTRRRVDWLESQSRLCVPANRANPGIVSGEHDFPGHGRLVSKM